MSNVLSRIAAASNPVVRRFIERCAFVGGAVLDSFGQTLVTITYAASMTPDLSLGALFQITATNNTAFTINAPTGTPLEGQVIEFRIRNASGGALGAVTWNAIFKLAAWTQPANGFSRAIEFRWNGTNWVEQNRNTADIPN